ncbi:hypothetical protein SpCBS45565_g03652 [Spizellomyces sp. 'palustris']|nr:hypothetical protein SpCBS45565_g03652 [Spizellomyces sp. 'palustris']
MQTYLSAHATTPISRFARSTTKAHAARSTEANASLTYDLSHLEEGERIVKLTGLLEAKDQEIADLKRKLAARKYDAAWDRVRQAGSPVSPSRVETSSSPAPVPTQVTYAGQPKEVSADTRTSSPEGKKGCTDERYEETPVVVRNIFAHAAGAPREHETPVSGSQEPSSDPRKDYRRLLFAMKHKIKQLQERLVEVQATATADKEACNLQLRMAQEMAEAKDLRLRAYESLARRTAGVEDVHPNSKSEATRDKDPHLDAQLARVKDSAMKDLIKERDKRRKASEAATQTEEGDTSESFWRGPRELIQEEYEDLRLRLHELADSVHRSILSDVASDERLYGASSPSANHVGTAAGTQPISSPPNPPSRSASPSTKIAALASAFSTLHAALTHLSQTCNSTNERAGKAHSELRRTVGALKRAREDLVMAEKVRGSLVERENELRRQIEELERKLRMQERNLEGTEKLVSNHGRQMEVRQKEGAAQAVRKAASSRVDAKDMADSQERVQQRDIHKAFSKGFANGT